MFTYNKNLNFGQSRFGQTRFGQSRFWPKSVWPKSVWPKSVWPKSVWPKSVGQSRSDNDGQSRFGQSRFRPHEDHLAAKGINTLSHCNLVHMFSDVPSIQKTGCKGCSGKKEWEKLEKIPAWQLTKVRNKKE